MINLCTVRKGVKEIVSKNVLRLCGHDRQMKKKTVKMKRIFECECTGGSVERTK